MPSSHAAIIGRSHRLIQQNSHDFAISGQPTAQTAFGLVLDGCGSKVDKLPAHNEVGAKLLGQFAAGYLSGQLLVDSEQVTVEALAGGLYAAGLAFLRGVMALYDFPDEARRAKFVASNLLATMVGFVVVRETAVFFWQGDGYLVHNGAVTTLDSHNRPDYLAYRLLDGGEDGRFQTKTITLTDKTDWLAVATDGWRPDLLAGLAEPRSSLALQRWLNVQARQPGNFEDDGAVTVWWQNA